MISIHTYDTELHEQKLERYHGNISPTMCVCVLRYVWSFMVSYMSTDSSAKQATSCWYCVCVCCIWYVYIHTYTHKYNPLPPHPPLPLITTSTSTHHTQYTGASRSRLKDRHRSNNYMQKYIHIFIYICLNKYIPRTNEIGLNIITTANFRASFDRSTHTGVPVHIKHVFSGAPTILNRFSRE